MIIQEEAISKRGGSVASAAIVGRPLSMQETGEQIVLFAVVT